MKKFGWFFQKEIRHYTLVRNRLEAELEKGKRLITIIHSKTPLQRQLIPLTELLIEGNRVVVDCFRSGHISSGLHQLRLVQEVVHKMWAMFREPRLAQKKKVAPGEVRKAMRQEGVPDWGDFYSQLSQIAHTNRDFLFTVFQTIKYASKVSKESKMFIEYYLMILNTLNQKALYVLFKSLKPHTGGDYRELVSSYTDLERIVQADWYAVGKKQRKVFNV